VAPPAAPFDLSALAKQTDAHARAALVAAGAKAAGVRSVNVTAEDILRGRPRQLGAFVAAILAATPRPATPQAGCGPERAQLRARDPESREEQTFVNWMLSLGVTVQDFFEDCRTGLPLLQVEDALRPGVVRWASVYAEPRSVFQRVSNCNHACSIATRELFLSLVGVGGKDIADGSRKLTLALVWQLLRFHVTLFLAAWGRSEADILTWANSRVRDVDSRLGVRSLSDPSLRSGVFVLQLVRAVAPECVVPAHILPGVTADEGRLNAKYAVSVVHKLGRATTVFATWEDIVECRPKMLLTLFAAIMAEDLERSGKQSNRSSARSSCGGGGTT